MLPHQPQQLLAGQCLPGAAAELQEQPQLGRGELQFLPVLGHRHRGAVDDQRAERRRVARLALPAAQHRADPGVQHPALHGLDHVVVGAGLQPDHHVDVVAARGQQDDRQLVGPADPPADLETVDSGQHDVEHDQIRPLLAQQLETVLTARSGRHAVPLAGQGELQGRTDGVVVLDQQQGRHGLILAHGPHGGNSGCRNTCSPQLTARTRGSRSSCGGPVTGL